jgi:hypothetical protein
MMSMLVLVPTMVVVMLGPELSSFPFKLQVMVNGMSPLDTTQVSWTKSPESTMSVPNENGAILGGSKTRSIIKLVLSILFIVPSLLTSNHH